MGSPIGSRLGVSPPADSHVVATKANTIHGFAIKTPNGTLTGIASGPFPTGGCSESDRGRGRAGVGESDRTAAGASHVTEGRAFLQLSAEQQNGHRAASSFPHALRRRTAL